MTKVYASYVCVRDRLLHTFFSCVRDTPILIGFEIFGRCYSRICVRNYYRFRSFCAWVFRRGL